MRNAFWEAEEKKEALDYARKAPIYVEPSIGNYLYPKTALLEAQPVPREVIPDSGNLFYDFKKKKWYDVNLGEVFIEVESPEKFDRMRQKAKGEKVEKVGKSLKKQKKMDNLVIYYVKVKDVYFYPKVALGDENEAEVKKISINYEVVVAP